MSSSYSYLDVAVLDAVRKRFAAGDALTILSPDLAQVLWANGPGARLFGYPDIESVIDAAEVLPPIARRQLTATAGFPDIGAERPVALRLTTGMASQTVALFASSIAMPDGGKAILLAAPAPEAGSGRPSETAARALSGFTEGGEFLAFVDGQGGVEAASEGFASLGFSAEALAGLVAEAAGEGDRLVKRLVRIGDKAYPAGVARLTDDPVRHLLVVVDEGPPGQAEAETGPDERPALADVDAGAPGATGVPTTGGMAPAAETRSQHDHWYFAGEEGDARIRPAAVEPAAIQSDAASDPSAEEGPGPDHAAPPPAAIDRNAAPVRFVWRTDADGAFSAISPEFAALVGGPAANVIGRRFRDVAAAFDLDPTGEIAQLLERRDTWSGRTVRWPAAGLRIPVDLAALPVYSRNREFEGFRGFGVARPADASLDPDAGKPLNEEAPPAMGEGPARESGTRPETSDGAAVPADPFKGEVPALSIEPKPDRRFTDKVIRLAEHRPPANDKGLSNVERSAFREIGERLRKDSAPAGAAQPADQAASGEAAGPERTGRQAPPQGEAEAGETAAEAPAGAAPIGPATEPGRVNSGDVAAQDDSERPAAGADAQDAAGPGSHEDATPPGGEAAAQAIHARARSLLDYADQASDAGTPASAEFQPVDAPARQEPAGPTGDEAAARAAEADDSMAAADLADARDDETLPTPGDRPARHEGEIDVSAEDERTAEAPDAAAGHGGSPRTDDGLASPREETAERPRLPVPPLRSEGVVPSAFAAANTPDTSILAKLPMPLLIHSGDTLHYANDEFLDLTGYAALDDLTHAGGLGALFADPYADDNGADRSERAVKLRTRDGREFPVDALLRTVPWRGGKALMLVLRRSGSDNETPREATSPGPSGDMVQPDVAELKARIAEMRTIIDTATDGVVLIGRDGAIRSISRPAEALFGFDSDEVAGKPFASLFAIESQRSASDYLASLSEPGVASVLNDGREVIGRESQGRFIPLFMTVGRLPGDSGYCAVVRDITQWKRAEEDLTQARAVAERASSQKTDFLARISHEIRTPLNAIIGFSELMVDEKFGPVANDRYRDYLRDINRSGNHVLDLVNDLLDISKIEAGQQEMEYEAVSLNDALAEAVALMQPQANRERVIIRSSLASRLPEVVADLRSIRQIALNILSNAIRYTQAGGQVIVSTAYETTGDVIMRVRDTGVGMTQSEIEQALKPFKQLNALKRGRGDGTGLGLPLTKAMVEANRAQFTIHSTPGEGTLVEIAFPSTRVLAE